MKSITIFCPHCARQFEHRLPRSADGNELRRIRLATGLNITAFCLELRKDGWEKTDPQKLSRIETGLLQTKPDHLTRYQATARRLVQEHAAVLGMTLTESAAEVTP